MQLCAMAKLLQEAGFAFWYHKIIASFMCEWLFFKKVFGWTRKTSVCQQAFVGAGTWDKKFRICSVHGFSSSL